MDDVIPILVTFSEAVFADVPQITLETGETDRLQAMQADQKPP